MSDFVIRVLDATGSLRFAAELHSTLDGRYYPKGVRGSFISDVFEGWGEQLYEADQGITNVYNDQFLDTVRVSPHASGRAATKLFDNFGTYVGPDIVSFQGAEVLEIGPTGSGWQGYRNQVDYMLRGAYQGGTREGTEDVGYAFSGVGAVVESNYNTPRWRLLSATGTVVDSNQRYLITNQNWFPRNLWRGAWVRKSTNPLREVKVTRSTENRLYFDEETDIRSFFDVGDLFTVSFSHLGTKTNIYSEETHRAGVSVHIWVPAYEATASLPPSIFEKTQAGVNARRETIVERKETILSTLRETLPAHVRPNVVFQDNYKVISGTASWNGGTFAPTSGAWEVTSQGLYVVNTNATCTWTSSPIDLGADYRGHAWYPDWMAETKNDSSIQAQVRFADGTSSVLAADWYSVIRNAPISNSFLGRYAQLQIQAMASGTLDILVHAISLKGLFKSPSSFMGTMPRGAERASATGSSGPTHVLGDIETPVQYGELIE